MQISINANMVKKLVVTEAYLYQVNAQTIYFKMKYMLWKINEVPQYVV